MLDKIKALLVWLQGRGKDEYTLKVSYDGYSIEEKDAWGYFHNTYFENPQEVLDWLEVRVEIILWNGSPVDDTQDIEAWEAAVLQPQLDQIYGEVFP
jgi:hypothetical protein